MWCKEVKNFHLILTLNESCHDKQHLVILTNPDSIVGQCWKEKKKVSIEPNTFENHDTSSFTYCLANAQVPCGVLVSGWELLTNDINQNNILLSKPFYSHNIVIQKFK